MLIRVHAQVEHARDAQTGERIGPDVELAGLALFAEHHLEVAEAHGDQLAIVVEIEEVGE